MARSKKKLTYCTGERLENRVRLIAKHSQDKLYLVWSEGRGANGKPAERTKALGHGDWEEGKRAAQMQSAKLLEAIPEVGPLTLGSLFGMYLEEKTPFKKRQGHDHRALSLFAQFWGNGRQVASLSDRDFNKFILARRAGVVAHKDRKGKPVRNRIIQQDLSLLRSVFNWALRGKDATGKLLLAQNPLRGFQLPSEKNPEHAILAPGDYAKLCAIADGVDPRFHLALVVCSETGHRLESVRNLTWGDVDPSVEGAIVWPAEWDKIEYEHEAPLSEEGTSMLLAAREKAMAQGATNASWVFPSPRTEKPLDRGRFHKWWKKAREHSQIKQQTGAFHTLRREFVTELREAGATDKEIADLGGWKCTRTLDECYDRPNKAQLRRALGKRKRRIPVPEVGSNPDTNPDT